MNKRRNRELKHVHKFTDRHGKVRRYYRPDHHCTAIRLTADPETDPALYAEQYHKAASGQPIQQQIGQEKRSLEKKNRAVKEPPQDVGVYLLLLKGKIIYVGTSLKMRRRVDAHRANGRPFDQAFYIGTTLTERIALEEILIAALAPKQNRRGVKMHLDRELPSLESGWEAVALQNPVIDLGRRAG